MPQETNTKIYDLEERTYKFASSVRTVVKGIEFMKCFGQRCHSRPDRESMFARSPGQARG